jgi:3-(3-hydroxy-phenyl)propionate hydroxylase
MRFKPMPHYRDGFLRPDQPGAREARTGRMLPQPQVEALDGTHLRLDDALGPWFAVVGFECDPLATLTPTELDVIDRLAGRPVKVIESRAGTRQRTTPCLRGDTFVVEDLHNRLRPWFAADGRRVVLVRPDRYVAAAGDAEGIGPQLTALGVRFLARASP